MAVIFRRDSKKQMDEDLMRMKSLIETGKQLLRRGTATPRIHRGGPATVAALGAGLHARERRGVTAARSSSSIDVGRS